MLIKFAIFCSLLSFAAARNCEAEHFYFSTSSSSDSYFVAGLFLDRSTSDLRPSRFGMSSSSIFEVTCYQGHYVEYYAVDFGGSGGTYFPSEGQCFEHGSTSPLSTRFPQLAADYNAVSLQYFQDTQLKGSRYSFYANDASQTFRPDSFILTGKGSSVQMFSLPNYAGESWCFWNGNTQIGFVVYDFRDFAGSFFNARSVRLNVQCPQGPNTFNSSQINDRYKFKNTKKVVPHPLKKY